MIAAWLGHSEGLIAPKRSILDALGGFGGSFSSIRSGSATLFRPTADAASSQQANAPMATVLYGWIDHADELAASLGAQSASHPDLYSAALARWGERADLEISGNYAAISSMPDGSLRLSRSAWSAPPLYYTFDGTRAAASPFLRVLFAAGARRELDYDAIVDQLAAAGRHGELGTAYKDISRVSLGQSLTLLPVGGRPRQWYDPAAIKPADQASDAEYVGRVQHLISEAARQSLIGARKPALALSGGLDSPLVAAALLDADPYRSTLDTITFRPDPDWPGTVIPGIMGDEAPLVREFAAMHPRISAHFADPAQGGFAFKSREMAAAMQCFAPGLANVGMYHGIFAKAKELGCDWLLTADLANQSFSADGRWTYVEYARSGKWAELARLLRNRPGDNRPLWRKILSLSVLPQLPVAVQNRLRGMVHPARSDMLALLTPLSAAARKAYLGRSRTGRTKSALQSYAFPRSRMDAAMHDHAGEDGEGADINLAFEQLYGIRQRDVTAYRPLIEFCIGLPSEQFASGGVERRLARSLAKGRMPEAQRLNTDYGQHNIDWITRIGRERASMLASVKTMKDHTFLSGVLDLDRIESLLRDWPEKQTFDIDSEWPRMFAIPQAMLAAQFIAMVEGDNRF